MANPTKRGDATFVSHLAATHTGSIEFLRRIGVSDLPPCTTPVDLGYDHFTVEGHLEQSSHLMELLKLSMSCWLIADEDVTRRKIAAASVHSVPTVIGGSPFEIAIRRGQLETYLDLIAELGVTRIECGEGFADLRLEASRIVKMAHEHGLEVQFELGKKRDGTFTSETVRQLVAQGQHWLDAGALQLVIEAREEATGVGLFDEQGQLDRRHADQFAHAFGLETVMFETPTKASQFAVLDHFGRDAHLCNVRLEDLLHVEIYRRELHSDAYARDSSRHRSSRPTVTGLPGR